MNQQHYPGGMIPSSSDSSVKRRRGRPRKEDSLGKSMALGSPLLVIRPANEVHNFTPPMQPQTDLGKGKARVEDVNSNSNSNSVGIKDDEMIGKAVTGVLEGMFDAGYFLSVKVGESDTKLRGIVFQPGKFVPVTEENDIAPSAKMYSRIDVSKSVEPVCFALFPPTVEKNECGLVEAKETEKEHDPIIVIEPERIMVEELSHVIVKEGSVFDNRVIEDVTKNSDEIIIEEPSEVFMECEGFGGKEANVEQKHEDSSELEAEKIRSEKEMEARNSYERVDSPYLELSLSNSSFSIEVPVDVSKPNEAQGSIPLQILDTLASSVGEKALEISMDAYEGKKTNEDDSEDVSLQPQAKKPKIEETMEATEVGASEPFLSPEDLALTALKELVGSQGFKDPSCELKTTETE